MRSIVIYIFYFNLAGTIKQIFFFGKIKLKKWESNMI
jgi:hypothetical protein